MLRGKELISLFIVKTNILFCCIIIFVHVQILWELEIMYTLMAEILYTFNTPLWGDPKTPKEKWYLNYLTADMRT
jgi:hypothetical protein